MNLSVLLVGFVTLIASKAPNVEVFQPLIMSFVLPLQFASNITYPIEIMPNWLHWFVKFIPLSYAVAVPSGLLADAFLMSPVFESGFILITHWALTFLY